MYTIRVQNMQFHGHIGVLPEEKKVGQTLQVDLEVVINAVPVADQLASTVSYGDFYPIVEKKLLMKITSIWLKHWLRKF